MEPYPEDGSLEEITSSGLNSEFNIIIIRRTDKFMEQDGGTFVFASLDRTREGVEWPGDQILKNLIPELPKVKTSEVQKLDLVTKTVNQQRPPFKRKSRLNPKQKNNFPTTRRQKPPQKKFCSDQSENTSSFNDIDPWVHKPWENQTFFPPMNTAATVSATSLISSVPFDNCYVPTSTSQHIPPRTNNNIFNVPNSSTYEKNIRPTKAQDNSFINNHLGHLNQPPPTNRLPIDPLPPFPLPNRFSQPPDRGFCGPVPNVDLNGLSHNTSLLGEPPAATRYGIKHGLLGDSPFSNMPFNRNLSAFPNDVSTQSNSGGNTTILLHRNEGSIIPRSNFDQHKDDNEISVQESCNSYEYPNNSDNSFRNTNEKNFSRYQNSGSSINHYKNQYKDSYNHLDHRIKPNDNTNISLKSSRNSYNTSYGRYKKPSAEVSPSNSGYKEVGDNLCESNYKIGQISSITKTPHFMNNWNKIPKKDSLIHISDSAVVYDPEDFKIGHSAATNSSISNPNSVSRSNFKQNTINNYGKSKREKYNQGQQRFRKQ